MKKLILSGLLLVAISFTANAQAISKNALGLRFGSGYGPEISYQRKLSKNNRLEANLGWSDDDHYDSFKLTGLYQWLWNIDGGFYWYAGAGAGIGSYDDNFHDNDGTFATLSGDIGIEYNFDFPLQIALDLRPEIYFGNDSDGHPDDHSDDDFNDSFQGNLGLALRYRFN